MLFVPLFVNEVRAKVQHTGMSGPASGTVLLSPAGPEGMQYTGTCGYMHRCVVYVAGCSLFSITKSSNPLLAASMTFI